jgi:hypothetical protein
LEREAFFEPELRRRLADALVVALSDGIEPWSWHTRELATRWAAAAALEFRLPDSVSPDVGWLVDSEGVLGEIPATSCEWMISQLEALSARSLTLPSGVTSISRCVVGGAGWPSRVLAAASTPSGVKANSGHAFWFFSALQAVTIAEGCLSSGVSSFCLCTALAEVTIPSTCIGAVRVRFEPFRDRAVRIQWR